MVVVVVFCFVGGGGCEVIEREVDIVCLIDFF